MCIDHPVQVFAEVSAVSAVEVNKYPMQEMVKRSRIFRGSCDPTIHRLESIQPAKKESWTATTLDVTCVRSGHNCARSVIGIEESKSVIAPRNGAG